jgi:hypothetical protein
MQMPRIVSHCTQMPNDMQVAGSFQLALPPILSRSSSRVPSSTALRRLSRCPAVEGWCNQHLTEECVMRRLHAAGTGWCQLAVPACGLRTKSDPQ